MTRAKPVPQPLRSRRQIAVGIWSLLILPMALDIADVPVAAAMGIALLVSCGNTLAFLLFEENPVKGLLRSRFGRLNSLVISMFISLVWAVWLGYHCSPVSSMMLMLPGWGAVLMIELARNTSTAVRLKKTVREVETATYTGTRSRAFESNATSTNAFSADGPASDLNERQQVESDSPGEFAVVSSELFAGQGVGSDVSILRMEPEDDAETEVSFDEPEPVSPDVIQWIKRSRTLEGEVIQGGVRIEFADNQKDATVHIAFCPPFALIPRIATEDLDGEGLEIRVAATFSFGARLTVRRPKQSESVNDRNSYRIGFVAIADSIRRAA